MTRLNCASSSGRRRGRVGCLVSVPTAYLTEGWAAAQVEVPVCDRPGQRQSGAALGRGTGAPATDLLWPMANGQSANAPLVYSAWYSGSHTVTPQQQQRLTLQLPASRRATAQAAAARLLIGPTYWMVCHVQAQHIPRQFNQKQPWYYAPILHLSKYTRPAQSSYGI
jgi:hypothetical protein